MSSIEISIKNTQQLRRSTPNLIKPLASSEASTFDSTIMLHSRKNTPTINKLLGSSESIMNEQPRKKTPNINQPLASNDSIPMGDLGMDDCILERVELNNQNLDLAHVVHNVPKKDTVMRKFDKEYFGKDGEDTSVILGNDPKNLKNAKYRFEQAHQIKFDIKIFIEFLIYHILYFFLLGPFIIILSPITGTTVMKNQLFWRNRPTFYSQTIQYFFIVSGIFIYYYLDHGPIHMIELYMVLAAVIIRIIFIASKYGHASKFFIKLMKTVILSADEFDSELILIAWRQRTKAILEEELQACILRLDIDMSLFYFVFITDVDENLKKQLTRRSGILKKASKVIDSPEFAPKQKIKLVKQIVEDNDIKTKSESKIGEIKINLEENQIADTGSNPKKIALKSVFSTIINKRRSSMQTPKNSIRSTNPTSRFDVSNSPLAAASPKTTPAKPLKLKEVVGNVKKMHRTTYAITKNFQELLGRKTIYDDTKFYGYSLAFDLIDKSKVEGVFAFGWNILFTSVIRSLIPILYRVYEGHPPFGYNSIQTYMIVSLFINGTFFFAANYSLVLLNVVDLKRRLFLLIQLTNLLSPKKDQNYTSKKFYPTLNIFDPVSIKMWGNLRKIFLDFGNKFHYRNNLNVAIYLAFYCGVVLILCLQFFGITSLYSDPLLLVVFGYESIVIGLIFLNMLILGSKINDQFRIHKNVLKKNKTIIANLLALNDAYFGPNPVEPDNFIYIEGVRILKEEAKKAKCSISQYSCERLTLLISVIDDEIEELEFEEINNPYKILGFTINYDLLKALAFGVVSILIALIQTLLNKGKTSN